MVCVRWSQVGLLLVLDESLISDEGGSTLIPRFIRMLIPHLIWVVVISKGRWDQRRVCEVNGMGVRGQGTSRRVDREKAGVRREGN